MKEISDDLYNKLYELGIIGADCRTFNCGSSDYSKHFIQCWSIWQDYNLNPWDADIIKRTLRHKDGDSRKLDYEKIKHICDERIRQIDTAASIKHKQGTDDKDSW